MPSGASRGPSGEERDDGGSGRAGSDRPPESGTVRVARAAAAFEAFWHDTLARVETLPLDVVVRERPGMTTDAVAATTTYPTEEYADHLRAGPGDRQALLATTALFDPVAHARPGRAQVLVPTPAETGFRGRDWLAPLSDALGARAESLPVTHRGGRDHDPVDAWIAAAMGGPAQPRSWRIAS